MNTARLFDPSSVAVVGASSTEGKIGHEAMRNAVEFDGRVYPVNPSGEGDLFGEPFVPSVRDIDEDVDLALLCVPAAAVTDVLRECGEADVGGAIVYAGGFAETDEEGERRQEEIFEIAREHGVAVLGPNTSGFVLLRSQLYASFAGGVDRLPAGDVAILAQSGGMAHTVAFKAAREGWGISAMVGLGNRAVVDFEAAIEYFDGHQDTSAIVLHVEGTDKGRTLLETCEAASTPVVAYKVGQSDVGEFAESHTGALTGDHDLYTAGFAQYGVPTVDSVAGLLDGGVSLAKSPTPEGRNVGVVTAQAGPGIAIADRLQRAGANLPTLTDSTQDRLEELLPGLTYAGNPVDTGRPMPEFGEVVETVAGDENVDVVLVYELLEPAIGLPVDTMSDLSDRVGKPVLFATEGPPGELEDELLALQEADVPTFTEPERAAEAAALLARYTSLGAGDPGDEAAAGTEVSRDV